MTRVRSASAYISHRPYRSFSFSLRRLFASTVMTDSQAQTVVGNGFRGRSEEEEEEEVRGNLKYLDFVHTAGVYVTICFYGLYEFAKFNSGPLLPGIQSVEDTIRAVVRPLYDKFRLLPLEALRFFDHKVDLYTNELDSLVPSTVKRALSLVRAAASELQEAGVVGTVKDVVKSMYYEYEPTAREVFVKYEPMVGHYVALACRWLKALPQFPQAAMLVAPTAAHWAEKYNSAVRYGADREYVVMEFLPLIPTEKIAKMFEEPEPEPEPEQEQIHGTAPAANGLTTNCFSGNGILGK